MAHTPQFPFSNSFEGTPIFATKLAHSVFFPLQKVPHDLTWTIHADVVRVVSLSYTHTNTHKHTHKHPHKHTHAHACACSRARTQTHTNTHKHTRTHIPHDLTRSTHADLLKIVIYTNACTLLHIHKHTHTNTNTNTHTNTHTHIHTHARRYRMT